MDILQLETKREVQIIETLPEYGEMYCRTIYCWYDGPYIYVVSNNKYRFLVYWFDSTGAEITYWYIPLSIEEQFALESHELCLRSFMLKKEAKVLKVNKDSVHFLDDWLKIRTLNSEQLPEWNCFMDIEEI